MRGLACRGLHHSRPGVLFRYGLTRGKSQIGLDHPPNPLFSKSNVLAQGYCYSSHNSFVLCFLITSNLDAIWMQFGCKFSPKFCKVWGAAEACSAALLFLAMFFFPLGSCIGRVRGKNTSPDDLSLRELLFLFSCVQLCLRI